MFLTSQLLTSLSLPVAGLLAGGVVAVLGVVSSGGSVWRHPNSHHPNGNRPDDAPQDEAPERPPVDDGGAPSPPAEKTDGTLPGTASVPSWALPWAPSSAPWRDRKTRIL